MPSVAAPNAKNGTALLSKTATKLVGKSNASLRQPTLTHGTTRYNRY